jgi:hypothetical protein
MKMRSIRQAPWTLAALGLLLASLAGCGGGTTEPTGTATTVNFSGTIGVGTSASHTVNVTQTSNLTVALVSLAPQPTITVRLGVGQISTVDGSCVLASYTDSARVGRVLTVAVNKGTLCVQIADIGNLIGDVDYVLSVAHF